jgi:MFS family permease
MDRFVDSTLAPGQTDTRYVTYLIIVALAGWALASYDVNLLVLALPDIAKSLKISQTGVGLLGFFVFGAQFVITLFAGYMMDRFGRRRVWMICLLGTAIFTGLTCLVQGFWELVAVRALASGLAYSELAVSITIVNEQVPAQRRGLLYSIVQGGWPLGVFLASGVYLLFGGMGWRFVFLLGVLPVVAVIAGRIFIRESPRFEREKQKAPDGLPKPSLRELFLETGAIRRQLFLLAITWVFYGASYVATNFYISYWLTTVKGFTVQGASALLLVCGGIGFFFYIIGGWLGERFGRREVIIVSGVLVAPLTVAMIYVHQHWLLLVMYFLLYQATNGTWSGAGYAYQGESFPTRLRGTAIGFLSAMQVMGFVVGSVLWIGVSTYGQPVLTWLVVATLMSLGMWCTLLLRRITPGQELEAIID